jgi:predicted ferric reductase
MSTNPRAFSKLVKITIAIGAALAALVSLVNAPAPLAVDSALIAHVSGLLAGYVVAIMVILMSRAPSLERGIGADRLARWHGRGGRVFVVLTLTHALAAIASWAASRATDPLTATLAVLGLPGLAAATAGTVLFLVIAAASIRMARRKVSYETWHGIHLLTYVALALSFAHELAGPNLAGQPIIQVAWSLLFVYSLALVARYRLLKPLGQAWRHQLRVERVVPEAPGVVSIILRGRHLEELQVEAGQFFRWRFLTRETWRSAHPFSVSAAASDNLLRITVKALGSGTTLLHSIEPGTRVLAEGPYGAMTARQRRQRSVLLIAGGVGITPMRALFEELDGDVTLLYRASSEADIVFRDELQEISAIRDGTIIWMVGRSSDPATSMVGDNLTRLVPDITDRDVYLCASPGLTAAVRTGLAEAGVPASQVHEEVFTF